MVKMVNS